MNRVSEYFNTTPSEGYIHIIIGPSSQSTNYGGVVYPTLSSIPLTHDKSPPLAEISRYTAPRLATVAALYERLNSYQFVLVRGTPASGKSTLAELLTEHIRSKEGVEPVSIGSWPRNPPPSFRWLQYMCDRDYDEHGPNIVIIDEAQETYGCPEFWNSYLKNIDFQHRDRVILFASYGSAIGSVSQEVEGTPMIIPNPQRIHLRRVNHGDGIAPVGLFLTKEEFDDIVKRGYSTHQFGRDFLDFIFNITAGHVGAIKDMLRIVNTDISYGSLRSNETYSLDAFWTQFPIKRLWDRLEGTSVFRRGLPRTSQLQEPAIARVFRAVLCHNATKKQMFESKQDQDALEQCWKLGWLHAAQDLPIYIFATPLHKWFVEYYLGAKVLHTTIITDQDLPTFTINVIQRFSAQQLSSPRTIGASEEQRPSEARFQDEFYRCCHQYSKGSLISFPEFGNARGKIDLCIPLKGWGSSYYVMVTGLKIIRLASPARVIMREWNLKTILYSISAERYQ